MKLESETIDGVTVVTLPPGPLEAPQTRDFMAAVRPMLAETNSLVLDLRDVTYMDSPGLVTLLSCLRHLAAKGGDLKLCTANQRLLAVFDSVGMRRLLDVFPTRDEAVKAFGGKA